MALTRKHLTIVIQFMLANGCVKAVDFQIFLESLAIRDEQLDEQFIFKIVYETNKMLNNYNMMLRSSMDEVTTEKYFVLISKVDNEITRAASHHTPKQFEFFKLILQAIVHEPRGIITDSALKELAEKATLPTSKSRGTLPEYKTTFNEWCQKNWFLIVTEDDIDFITLGVRSMAELDVFIKQMFEKPEDLNCKSCNNLSIYSISCSSCDARYHKRCSKLSIDRETGTCKGCTVAGPSTSDRRKRGK